VWGWHGKVDGEGERAAAVSDTLIYV
jgi:hypothetical protein